MKEAESTHTFGKSNTTYGKAVTKELELKPLSNNLLFYLLDLISRN